MNILVIAGHHLEAEFRAKFGPSHEYTFFPAPAAAGTAPADDASLLHQQLSAAGGVVFDCAGLLGRPGRRPLPPHVPVFQEMSGAAGSAARLSYAAPFGFCGLPTLLNRPLLEVSRYDDADADDLASVCVALGTAYRPVADRVGLVTPRVIAQIINEACYTVQEGTATMQAVDLSMKLGTNYPHGPFAWANALGVARVYAVLEALWADTHDERYKVCPLLKRQALRGAAFGV